MNIRKITIFIYLPNETVAVPAGIFTHDDGLRIGTFAYGRKYIERDNVLPVDPVSLSLSSRPYEVLINGGIYGAFRDASPDYWGRMVISAQLKAPPEALSEIDYLLASNATRVGNLDFRHSPDDPEPALQPPHYNQLAEIIEAAAGIEAGQLADAHLLQLLRQGSSMGGARPKCTVEWNDALWIAKFSARGDSLNIPRIEYATMSLARLCGIEIPEIAIITVGDQDIFLVRRFDRERTAAGWFRRGFLSGLSFMQWDEMDRPRWDYPAMADSMRRSMAVRDIQELYRRMVFNILVRNTDDHPRNHGFLVNSAAEIALSPAYDIVPTPTLAGVGSEFRLAMSIGGQGREATIDNALSHAGRFGLSDKEARAVVGHLGAIVCTWRDHFERCGVSGHDFDLLAPSFARCIDSKG
ncbi:MAG: hypothetical protein A2511_07830 [Deltaproteobacteria bacterium RIFOXYD12_FULL_50_9]|nr:MAG: hypothetical protein A2511_07830 [Deltaproteobacteria bacterium RIFOXYD12_FULL_50_9]